MSVKTSPFSIHQLASRLRCDVGDVATFCDRLEIPIDVHLSNSQLAKLEALRRDDQRQIERHENLFVANSRNCSESKT